MGGRLAGPPRAGPVGRRKRMHLGCLEAGGDEAPCRELAQDIKGIPSTERAGK